MGALQVLARKNEVMQTNVNLAKSIFNLCLKIRCHIRRLQSLFLIIKKSDLSVAPSDFANISKYDRV